MAPIGLSTTTAHFIWFFALLAVAGLGFQMLEVTREVSAAEEARDEQDLARLATRFAATSFCYNEVFDRVSVTATNTGSTYLLESGLTFVVDGVVASGFASTEAFDLWAPGETRTFVATGIESDPQHLRFVTADGVARFPVKRDCIELSTIVVTAASSSLAIGESTTLSASGYDQYGDPFPVDSFSWSALGGTVEQLTATTARYTAGTVSGDWAVEAQASGITGSATITIRPDAPASMAVSPDPVDVVAGTTQAFTATAYDAYGNVNSTAAIAWTTDAGTIDGAGVLTADTLARSGLSVTATSGAATGTAAVTIVPGPVARVTISPTSDTLLAGASRTFTAAAYDQHDNPIPDATFTWSALRGTVTSGGVYTAPALRGSDTVAVTSDGIQATATVTVTQTVHVASIETYDSSGTATGTFARSSVVEARVVLRDHNGNLVEGVSVSVQFVRPNSQVYSTITDATDAAGVSNHVETLPNGSPGTWSVRVSDVTATNVTYASASNIETTQTFQVS